jgi:CheY-like chemotaxis protein
MHSAPSAPGPALGPRPRILVAEDNDEMRGLLTTTLERAGYQVVPLEDGAELSDYLELINPKSTRTHQPDLVLTDVRMPGRSGLDVVQQARTVGLTCPVIVLSGFADEAMLQQARRLGDTTVLAKPIDVESLLAAIRRILSPAPVPMGTRVLLVEDNDDLRTMIRDALTQRGFVVEEARDGLQMSARLLADKKELPPPDVVVTDVRMPWSGGLDVLERLKSFGWKTRFIVMTAFGDSATHARAKQLGAVDVFDKPFEVDDLVESAVRATRKRRVH